MGPFKFVTTFPQSLRFPPVGFHGTFRSSHPLVLKVYSHIHLDGITLSFCFPCPALLSSNNPGAVQAVLPPIAFITLSSSLSASKREFWGNPTALRVTMLPTLGSNAHICMASVHEAKHGWLEK